MTPTRRALLAAAPLLVLPGCARAEPIDIQGELHRGLIFAQGRSGDATGWVLIATGAPLTVFDAAFAQRAGVAVKGAESLRGVGGSRIAGRGEPTVFDLGPASSTVQPSVADLSAVAARMGVALAGIAGGDVLGRYALTLDYRTARLRLSPPGNVTAPASTVPMRVGRTPYIRAVAVLGQRRAQAEFQIDTGANTAVVLWRRFAERAFPDAAGRAGLSAGVAGVERTLIGRLDALEVGASTLRNLETNFADETQPDDAGREYGGVIGGPVWTNLMITVDYPGGRFWIT
ncbi:MAG: aspartyl protease family protein [Caulobacteraceae bacterium]